MILTGPLVGYTNQGPEEVNGEESYSESDQAHSFQSAGEVKVVHGSPKTQPAWDGGQRRDQQETHHVSEQRALLLTQPGVTEPLHTGRNGLIKTPG